MLIPRSHALRGNALQDALRPVFGRRIAGNSSFAAQRAIDCIPTQRVGTRRKPYSGLRI